MGGGRETSSKDPPTRGAGAGAGAPERPQANPFPHTIAPAKLDQLTPLQRQAIDLHARDLCEVLAEQQGKDGRGRLGLIQQATRSPTFALLRAVLSAFGTLFTAFVTNPTAAVTSREWMD